MSDSLDQGHAPGQLRRDVRYGPDTEETHELRDGAHITVRMIRTSDRDELRRKLRALSPESRYRRFLGAFEVSEEALDYLVNVDGHRHVALVATLVSPDLKTEEGLGVARFVRLGDSDVAEAAVTVVDAAQHRGIGTVLAHALVEAARERGIRTFRAEVLGSNDVVRASLEASGAKKIAESDGTVSYEVEIGGGAEKTSGILSTALRLAAQTMAFVARALYEAAADAARPDDAAAREPRVG